MNKDKKGVDNDKLIQMPGWTSQDTHLTTHSMLIISSIIQFTVLVLQCSNQLTVIKPDQTTLTLLYGV